MVGSGRHGGVRCEVQGVNRLAVRWEECVAVNPGRAQASPRAMSWLAQVGWGGPGSP